MHLSPLITKRAHSRKNRTSSTSQTVVVTQNQVSCRLPEYFPDPDAFIPERWYAKGEIHPFLVLPFGHGPRACIGRRMAEQNMYTVIIQVKKKKKINMAFFLYSYFYGYTSEYPSGAT